MCVRTARLVWDANNPNGHYQSQQQPQRGYGNPQMAHVAPFQSQFNQNPPSPWLNPPFAVDAANNNNNGGNGSFGSSPASSMHHQAHANFAEPPGNYGPPPELLNNGIRPLMGPNSMPFNQQHHHNQAQQPLQQQQQQPQVYTVCVYECIRVVWRCIHVCITDIILVLDDKLE